MHGTPKIIAAFTFCAAAGLVAVVVLTEPATAPVFALGAFWMCIGLTAWGIAAFLFAAASAVLDKNADTALHGFGIARGKNLFTSLRRGLEVIVCAGAALILYRSGQPFIKPVLYLAVILFVAESAVLIVRRLRK